MTIALCMLTYCVHLLHAIRAVSENVNRVGLDPLKKTVSIPEVILQLMFSQILAFSVVYKGLNTNGCSSMTLYSED